MSFSQSIHVSQLMLICVLAQMPSHNSAPSPQTPTANHKAQAPMAKNECQRLTSPIVVSVRLFSPFIPSLLPYLPVPPHAISHANITHRPLRSNNPPSPIHSPLQSRIPLQMHSPSPRRSHFRIQLSPLSHIRRSRRRRRS